MIVECPACGTKNQLPDAFHEGYRCGSCNALIEPPSIFREATSETYRVASIENREVSAQGDSNQQHGVVAEERPFSSKRILGVALFGCVLAGYAGKACDFTVPTIISMIQGIDEETAVQQYEASVIFPFLTMAFGILLGSSVAAFLARRRAVVAGLLAGSPFALAFLTFTVLAVVRGDARLVGNISYQLYTFLLFADVVVASIIGALICQSFSDESWDSDLKQSKVTIFGVRWGHYFWILPLVVYPYLASVIMAIYAGVLTFLSGYYVAFHPSLWFSSGWMASFSLNPMAVYLAFWLLANGAERFLRVMAFGPSNMRRLAKVGRVILYGLLAPGLAFSVAAISASFTHASPSPTPGDWRIGVAIIGCLIGLSLLTQMFSWARARLRARHP